MLSAKYKIGSNCSHSARRKGGVRAARNLDL